jgi:hypothetical protein
LAREICPSWFVSSSQYLGYSNVYQEQINDAME